MRIVVVGAGKLGGLVAGRVTATGQQVWLLDKTPSKAQEMAEQIGCNAIGNDQLPNPQVVIMAVPDTAVLPAAKELAPHLEAGTVLVNMATKTNTGQLRQKLEGTGLLVVGVKFMGHAQETARGEQPLLVVEGEEAEAIDMVKEAFAPLGPVVQGPDDLVAQVNTLATKEAIKAAVAIEDSLREMGYGEELIKVALSNVAVGTIKAYSRGELGGFAQALVDQLRKG